MNRRSIRISLTLVICFSIFVSFIYCRYYPLAAADFISGDLKLESFDQERVLAASQNQLKVFRSVGFLRFQPGICLTGCFSHLSFRMSSHDQKSVILLC
jgi:hypothetical protein